MTVLPKGMFLWMETVYGQNLKAKVDKYLNNHLKCVIFVYYCTLMLKLWWKWRKQMELDMFPLLFTVAKSVRTWRALSLSSRQQSVWSLQRMRLHCDPTAPKHTQWVHVWTTRSGPPKLTIYSSVCTSCHIQQLLRVAMGTVSVVLTWTLRPAAIV